MCVYVCVFMIVYVPMDRLNSDFPSISQIE